MSSEKEINNSDQNDLIELLKTVWGERKKIVIITSVFIVLGVVVAFISPKEYEVTTVMIPQTKNSPTFGNDLGGLASIAGIDINSGGNSNEIPPSLYPRIIGSVPFQQEMLSMLITVDGLQTQVSFRDFQTNYVKSSPLGFVKKYTIGLPMTIYSAIRGGLSGTDEVSAEGGVRNDSLISLTQEDLALIKLLNKTLNLKVDRREGIIELTATMPTALSAAQVAAHAQTLLQKAVTVFKVQRAKEELLFSEQLYSEKKFEFEKIQEELGEFEDRNQNIVTATAKIERNRLEANYNLALSLYTQLAQQLENDKIDVKENTPSFTILQPVVIPLNPEKPNKKLLVVGFALIGLFVALGRIVLRNLIVRIKAAW